MKYEMIPTEVDVVQYEDGMENGYISVFDDDGNLIDVPFIYCSHGKVGVDENTWIVTFPDGHIDIYSERRFKRMFRKIE